MLQTYAICTEHLSVKLMFITSPLNILTLTAFGAMVKQLANTTDGPISEEMFLKNTKFSKITYNIITQITQ